MIHNNIVINSNINIVVQETFQRNAACASNDITRSIAVVIATHPFCCACWKLESMLYRLGIIRDNLDIELFVLKCWVTKDDAMVDRCVGRTRSEGHAMSPSGLDLLPSKT